MVWAAKRPKKQMTLKEFCEIAQSVVTIGAVIIGGVWTYTIFGKERKQYPHVNIEHKLSHVTLPQGVNLLRAAMELTNQGSSKLVVGKWTIRVQQILPVEPCMGKGPCVVDEIKDATQAVMRKSNNFSWPMIAKREENSSDLINIEPEEKQTFEFEFAVPPEVKVARVYSYFRNDQISTLDSEIGWAMSSYYDFRGSCDGGKK